MGYNIRPKVVLSSEYIFSRVTQEEVFERLFNMPVVTGKYFRSPLRTDNKPGCKFQYSRTGTLYFRDFSEGLNCNCVQMVEHMHNLYGRDARPRAKEIIAAMFNLDGDRQVPERVNLQEHLKSKENKAAVEIEVKYRKWEPIDKTFWYDRFGLSSKLLAFFEVYPISHFWLNGRILDVHSKHSPLYAYVFGEADFKIYRPYNENFRFITNSLMLQGYKQLPETGDLLVITKSLKDVMVLRRYGIYAVAPQGETIPIGKEMMTELKTRFKKIVSLYDFDMAGIIGANKLKRQYGVDPYFLTDGEYATFDYQHKDISDLREAERHDYTKQLIDEVKSNILSGRTMDFQQAV